MFLKKISIPRNILKELTLQNKEEYWKNFEENFQELRQKGFIKLPKINFIDFSKHAKKITDEMGDKTFLENGYHHKIFLNELGFSEDVKKKLYSFAKQEFNYKGSPKDQYHISRKVTPGNSKEMFRGHFDSHLLTFVFPISIPDKNFHNDAGQLIFFPHLRKQPSSEISNLVSKIWYKRYASQEGLEKLKKSNKYFIEHFEDMRPLLFLGNTFFHTNFPVSKSHRTTRLTLLAHFYDPSPKFGIGSVMRLLRGR